MKRIRPRTTVLGGAAIGLVAGAAIYGAVSSASTPTPPTLTTASAATASHHPAAPAAARCSSGRLDHGVCIVHVQRIIHVQHDIAGNAPQSGPVQTTTTSPVRGTSPATGPGNPPSWLGQQASLVRHEVSAPDLAAAVRPSGVNPAAVPAVGPEPGEVGTPGTDKAD